MTSESETKIEKIVMRRVYATHVLRPFVSGTTLALVLMLFALWGIGREVWVARVFENAPRDLLPASQFFMDAFVHTRVIVQALTLAALGSIIWLSRDLLRVAPLAFTTPRT
jgi:hypothetical protein